MERTKYKTCPICGKTFPATREYFKRNSNQTLHDICRQCEDEKDRKEEWKDGLLKCHLCGEYFPVSEFGKHDRYTSRDGRDTRCRKCRTKQAAENRKSFKGEYALLKVLQSRFLGAKDRAKKKNLPFTITKEYLKELWDKQNGKCAISGIEMTYSLCEGRIPTNVSIDQINQNDGYTKDNIQLVCMAVNQIKSDLQMDDVYRFCKAILENKERNEKECD